MLLDKIMAFGYVKTTTPPPPKPTLYVIILKLNTNTEGKDEMTSGIYFKMFQPKDDPF